MKTDIEHLTECIKEIVMTIGELTFEVGFSPSYSELPDIETYVGTVQILGDFNGCVKVSMSRDLAKGTAMRILCLDEGTEVTLYHIAQFMQEFTNMTGGNLKPALGETCALSVPKFIETIGFYHQEADSTRILEVDFACDNGGFLSVQIFNSVPDLKQEILSGMANGVAEEE